MQNGKALDETIKELYISRVDCAYMQNFVCLYYILVSRNNKKKIHILKQRLNSECFHPETRVVQLFILVFLSLSRQLTRYRRCSKHISYLPSSDVMWSNHSHDHILSVQLKKLLMYFWWHFYKVVINKQLQEEANFQTRYATWLFGTLAPGSKWQQLC